VVGFHRSIFDGAMPKRKCSAEEEIDNLEVRALEKQNKYMKAQVLLAIKNTPSVLPHLVRCMQGLGYDRKRISVPETMSESFQMQAVKARVEKKKSSEFLVKEESEAAGALPIDMVPSKYWKVSDLSRNLLRDAVLPGCEPRNLSSANLRSTCDALGVGASKAEYCRLWSFCTGHDDSFALSGVYRDFRQLRDDAFARAQQRGRRALLLDLPCNWPRDGIFRLTSTVEKEQSIVVEQRFNHVTVTVLNSKLPFYDLLADLVIDSNWSEKVACIKSTNQKADPNSSYFLSNDFPDHDAAPVVVKLDTDGTPNKECKSPSNNLGFQDCFDDAITLPSFSSTCPSLQVCQIKAKEELHAAAAAVEVGDCAAATVVALAGVLDSSDDDEFRTKAHSQVSVTKKEEQDEGDEPGYFGSVADYDDYSDLPMPMPSKQ
jgi:hypothetical protein